ncbi:hypothetical protein TrCOL_g7984 [Triparma columacea]|uniref:Uncharacterized protein n=1 Tax=Triparma columacea TaxID=722753 RepID=A0A9W7GNI8_9STRA|nr:hypothetical protein TrCOL_g7984 [Triparma columacea]
MDKDISGSGGRVVLALLWGLRDEGNCGAFAGSKATAFRAAALGADRGGRWFDEVRMCKEFSEGGGVDFVLAVIRSMGEGQGDGEAQDHAAAATTVGYAEVGMLWNLLDVRAMMSMQEFFHLLQQSSEERGSIKHPEEGGGGENEDDLVGVDEVRLFFKEFLAGLTTTLQNLING